MLIKELAEKTGLSVHALRYYEKEGLLAERFIRRSENNYRLYSDEAPERIMAIGVLQSAGFTLSEIRDFISRWDSGQLSPTVALELLQRKKDAIDARIADLMQTKERIVTIFEAHVKTASG
jgi:MerR family transcriptional regulator, copper efflux regulator